MPHIDEIPVAIFLVDKNHKITFANKETHRLFEYEYNELIGVSLDLLIPSKYREHHHAMADKYMNEIVPVYSKPLNLNRVFEGVTKNHKIISVKIGLYPYKEQILVVCIEQTVNEFNNIDTILNLLARKIKDL